MACGAFRRRARRPLARRSSGGGVRRGDRRAPRVPSPRGRFRRRRREGEENETNPRVGRVRRATVGAQRPRTRREATKTKNRNHGAASVSVRARVRIRRVASRSFMVALADARVSRVSREHHLRRVALARYCALRALSCALDAAERNDRGEDEDKDDVDHSLDVVVAYVSPRDVPRLVRCSVRRVSPLRFRASSSRDDGDRAFASESRPFAFAIRIVAIFAWCATCALLVRIGYAPSATFRGAQVFADADAAARFEEGLLPFGLTRVAHALAFLTVSWATSHVVFGVPWAVSTYVDDIRETPCDVPRSGPPPRPRFGDTGARSTSASPLFTSRMYAPLGSGHVGVVVVVAFSTLFHGFETGWLVWGAVNAAGLTIERLIDDSYPGWRFASRGARLAQGVRRNRRHVRHGGDVRPGTDSTRRRGRGRRRGSSRGSSRWEE